MNKMKDCILSSSSKFQVGGQPGHAPEEHIFTIKSLWEMLLMEGSGMILTLVDIVAFFDRENIHDVMQTLHEIGAEKKTARVWYKLNENTEVAVKTAGGVSETAFVGDSPCTLGRVKKRCIMEVLGSRHWLTKMMY